MFNFSILYFPDLSYPSNPIFSVFLPSVCFSISFFVCTTAVSFHTTWLHVILMIDDQCSDCSLQFSHTRKWIYEMYIICLGLHTLSLNFVITDWILGQTGQEEDDHNGCCFSAGCSGRWIRSWHRLAKLDACIPDSWTNSQRTPWQRMVPAGWPSSWSWQSDGPVGRTSVQCCWWHIPSWLQILTAHSVSQNIRAESWLQSPRIQVHWSTTIKLCLKFMNS